MDVKISDLPMTANALASLCEALDALNSALSSKKDDIAARNKFTSQQLNDNNNKIVFLKETSAKIIGQIDSIIENLDNVLEKNGSSNNND